MEEKINIRKELTKPLDKVFLICPRSKEMISYKNSVLDTMVDEFNKLIEIGKSEEKALEEITKNVDRFYDKEKVKKLEEIKGEKGTKKVSKNVVKIALWSVLCFVLLSLVIFVSIGISDVGWGVAGIVIGCIYAVPVVVAIFTSIIKTISHKAFSANRLTIWLLGMGLVTLIYLIVSFSLNATGNFNYVVGDEVTSVWALTWLTFIFGLVVVDTVDLIFRVKNGKRIYSAFDAFLLSILITLAVYLSSSIIMDIACGVSIWSKSWIIMFVGVFVYAVMMLIRQIFKLKHEEEK